MGTLEDLRAVAPYIDSSLQPVTGEVPALLAALCYKLDGLDLEQVVIDAKVEDSVEASVAAKVSDTISPPPLESPPGMDAAASPVAPPPGEATLPVPPTGSADAGATGETGSSNPAGWSATVSAG